MKNIVLITFLFILTLKSAYSQRIDFIQVKGIEYHEEYELWDDWPDEWVDLNGTEKYYMIISQEVRGKVYKVYLYVNGELIMSSSVWYDSEKSKSVRVQWDSPYVNCYVDELGNYIYAENVSLEQLALDSSPWKRDDSRMYFWLFDINLGLALR
jgi:hypothetical protein